MLVIPAERSESRDPLVRPGRLRAKIPDVAFGSSGTTFGDQASTRSMTAAMPWPTPMHMVTSA